ncbi:MAG: FtsX-like permease family protein [bacterium]|nr:FtsX-like permease family protein [bacterium]
MFKNYLKIAVRNLLKHKAYSLINIMGLAIGMACCVLILLFVRDELNFDRFHENAERLHRVNMDLRFPEQPIKYTAVTPTPLAPALVAEFPEVTAATRLLAYFEAALPGKAAVSHEESQFNDHFFWADSSFFKVFSLPLLRGNPDRALADPYTVVITEEMAHKYFGDEDPMGKLLKIDTGFSAEGYVITGVMGNVPRNSHLALNVLASLASIENLTDERVMMDNWWDFDTYTYALLAEGSSAGDVEGKFPDFFERHVGERGPLYLTARLMPIADIHLHSHRMNEITPNSDIVYVYVFSVVALVILLVACINFMNLATARSASRAREVGMRKVVGAHRLQLIWQFLGESILISAIAMVVAVFLVKLSLPLFNAFVSKEMVLGYDAMTWLSLLGMTLLVGVVAGSYPAFFLSSFRPINVLGGFLMGGSRSVFLRKLLVVSQFTFSVILIIGTLIIFDQLSYMRSSELGFDMERIVILPVRDSTLQHRYLTVKDRVEQVPNIESTALSALIMGKEAPDLGTLSEGAEEWKLLGSLIIDQDWVDFYGVELIAGRNFSRAYGDADLNAFILTESGVRELGWDSPEEALGKEIRWGGTWREGSVIGVVRDFHYQPLRYKITPVIMLLRPIAYHFLAVKIGPGDLSETLKNLDAAWDNIFPDRAFEYFFLEDEFNRMYRADERLGQLVGFFSLVAVFLGCLGLLGLASFTAEQRTKEIGVRKALGASAAGVMVLLSKEFTRLIAVAIVIAWPVAYLVMREWLTDFAYRTEMSMMHFVLGGLAALVIGALTIGFQTIKAALTNPADALRYE